MSSRKHLRHGLLVAALGALGLVLPPGRAAADDCGPRTDAAIVAQGTGEVSVRPDSIRVELSVEAQTDTLDAATSGVNAAMSEVIDALRGLGLRSLTIETDNVHFSPVYGAQNSDSTQAIIAYNAQNTISVTQKHVPVEQLSPAAAQIVDAALHAGANRLGGIDFFLADPSQAEDQALTLAVENAHRDAETIAQAAGVSLTCPVSIEEASASRLPRALSLPSAIVSTPIEVGDLRIDVTVTARYAFRTP